MASIIQLFVIFSLISLFACTTNNAQLSPSYYSRTCPYLHLIVRNTMRQAIINQPRLGASILRLHFHDCFVNGCDGSLLLDDTSSLASEKNAFPNKNSVRGFELVDTIKANVEAECRGIVSCADILALAAEEAVCLSGGPSWSVPLGRRDARTASQSTANANLPPPSGSLSTLITLFAAQGLNARDMTALSGAHTIGQARCTTFRDPIYNDTNIDPTFANTRKSTCPGPASGTGDDNLAPLDSSPGRFDTSYFQDLVARRGLFRSDQELFNGGSQDELVRLYSSNYRAFASDFVNAMIKMGNISPLTGLNGEIRRNCRFVN